MLWLITSSVDSLDSEPVAYRMLQRFSGGAICCVAFSSVWPVMEHTVTQEISRDLTFQQELLLETHAASSDLQPLPSMDSKTTVDALARYLRDPKAIFPNAHMPSMKLTSASPSHCHVLKGQAAGMFGAEPMTEKTSGLKYHYLEFGTPSREASDIVSDLKEHFPGDNPPDLQILWQMGLPKRSPIGGKNDRITWH